MVSIDERIATALSALPPKPVDTATRAEKKAYSERLSRHLAEAFGAELRERGMPGARPAQPGELDASGAERRMAGGIGAKKVDVTWATEESGLLLGISIKTINFIDLHSRNFQKNLINRRGDMLTEAVTLHRRFPYAVLVGCLFLDGGAELDGTPRRASTFINAHRLLKIFTGRTDPTGRDEQFEKLYLVLVDASASTGRLRAFEVGNFADPLSLDAIFAEITRMLAERNSDFYESLDGRLVKVPG